MAVTVYIVSGTILTEAEYKEYIFTQDTTMQEALKLSGLDWQVESE